MKGKKRNYYNVYQNDELIAEAVNNQEVCELTGIKNTADVSNYSNQGKKFQGIYKIEVHHAEEEIKEPKLIRCPEQNSAFNDILIAQWNNMKAAADLLKAGKGRIVRVGKRKYVEAIR